MWTVQGLYRFAMTGAVTPVFEGSVGYGSVTHGADWSGQQTFEAALARLGAGVQVNFEPVRGALIRGGLLFAVEGWLPLAHDHTGPAADVYKHFDITPAAVHRRGARMIEHYAKNPVPGLPIFAPAF